MAPKPPAFGTPRRSRGVPLSSVAIRLVTWGPRNGPQAPPLRHTPAKPWRGLYPLSPFHQFPWGPENAPKPRPRLVVLERLRVDQDEEHPTHAVAAIGPGVIGSALNQHVAGAHEGLALV